MQHTKIMFLESLSNEMHRRIYEFEKEIFYPIFIMAPSNYEEFKKIRRISKMSASLAMQGDKIISLIVNEKLTNEHVQSVIIGTKENHRGKGFIKSLSKINFEGLNSIGFKYISFWSAPDTPIFKIYSESLSCISTEMVLTSHELKLRSDYFKARKADSFTANLRTINNFYKLKDNTVSPASFWAFKLR
jgi:hypothetical protein